MLPATYLGHPERTICSPDGIVEGVVLTASLWHSFLGRGGLALTR
jgi:hypothetical protein